ncbi:MAG: peroxiredoxin [Phycisphaerae bacterium]|nr:peroxiredoxin [Phycisphaerae bacterium]
MSIRTGDSVQGFSLPARPGEMIDLAECIGTEKVVLLFFPLSFSPVCTDEFCAIRDDWSAYADLGAKVFGISIDSPFVTAKFAEELGLPFPLLSDMNRDVCRMFDVLHEDLFGMRDVAKRSVFVIDKGGSVVYDSVSDDPKVQVDFEAIRSALGS